MGRCGQQAGNQGVGRGKQRPGVQVNVVQIYEEQEVE